jgi:membrane protein implicated in regulation of membrane protease activity
MGLAAVLKRWLSIAAIIAGGTLIFPALALVTTVLTGLMTAAVALLAIARAVADRLPASRKPPGSRHGTTFGFRH